MRFLVILRSWITLVFDSRSNGTSSGQLKSVSIFVIALALVGKVFDKRQQLPCCIAQCARLTVSANHICLLKDKQSKSPVRFRSLASYENVFILSTRIAIVCAFFFPGQTIQSAKWQSHTGTVNKLQECKRNTGYFGPYIYSRANCCICYIQRIEKKNKKTDLLDPPSFFWNNIPPSLWNVLFLFTKKKK